MLILFKGRSKDKMMIHNKAADIGFKCYSLCVENYLLGLRFTSKRGGIDQLKPEKGLSPSSALVVNLMEKLPKGEHVVYLDNFFTNEKLLLALKDKGYAACGTCKKGSGIGDELVSLKEVMTKSKDWGTQAITTQNGILRMAWQDNNDVLLMSTSHDLKTAQSNISKDLKKRHNIPKQPENQKTLLFPTPI